MYEIPQLPLDDASGKDSQARSENVITSSNPAYGHFRTSRQEYDTKEDKEGKRLDQIDEAYEIPRISARDDTSVKTNPARSENVITSNNLAYGHFQISRQKSERKKEEEGEKQVKTYEPIPFDTTRQ